MVAFNFQQRFAPLVASRVKLQTIRQTIRAKKGDRIQLYTGMRTKSCKKLVEPDPVCVLVDYVGIRPDYLTLGNTKLHAGNADDFAMRDGFEGYDDMIEWFFETYGSRFFTGHVHVWTHEVTL